MGNGCLKPKARSGQIYIDCINEIYEELKLINQSQYKNHNDTYAFIKEKIQKKGWLRKLMDYLTSHRQSISEAALHNFRLTVQMKGSQFKVTGLIIIDYIINAVIRQSGLDMGQKIGEMVIKMIMKQKDINAQSLYQESQHKRQSFPKNSKSFQNVLHTASSAQNLSSLEQGNNLSLAHQNLNNNASYLSVDAFTNPNHNQINSLMLRQIYNLKFSNIYYNMLYQLLSAEDQMYVYGLKSIVTYTKYHQVKNIQQQKIVDLLQIFLEHVQTGDEVTLSLRAYQMLLQKLKEPFLENQLKQLKLFFKIWEESFRLSNDEQNQFSMVNNQNRQVLESIIQKMISAMIGSVSVSKIYQQIILVYDQHKFENMIHFQEMLISITKKDQLKNQFFRGLYSFLLSYLAVCKGATVSQSNKSIQSKQIKNNASTLYTNKWPYLNSSKSYQAFLNQYQNISDAKVKRSVINTLKRWTKSYEFIEINQIIKYNSSLLVNSFLFNIHESFLTNSLKENNKSKASNSYLNLSNNSSQLGKNNSNYLPSNSTSSTNSSQLFIKDFPKYLCNQFCHNFCKSAQIQQRISLINKLYDEIRSLQLQDKQKLLYLQMIDTIMYQQWIQSNGKVIQFCQLDTQYSNLINHQLLNHTNVLINKLTEKMLYRCIDQICYFLFSMFQLFNQISLQPQECITLLNSAIKLIHTIERSNGSLIILAYSQRMIKAINSDMAQQNVFICWDLILNCAYILLTSPRNYNKSVYTKQLNQIYIQITRIEQLKAQVNKLTSIQFNNKMEELLVDAFGGLTQTEQDEKLLSINLPKKQDFEAKHAIHHDKVYELASIAFRDMFSRGVSCAKGGFLNVIQEDPLIFTSQTNGFGRMNSIIREQEVCHEQASIADVMEMINL